jgi:hypothetical protein
MAYQRAWRAAVCSQGSGIEIQTRPSRLHALDSDSQKDSQTAKNSLVVVNYPEPETLSKQPPKAGFRSGCICLGE